MHYYRNLVNMSVFNIRRRQLRSASTAEVLVPAMRCTTIGDRALAVAGPFHGTIFQ